MGNIFQTFFYVALYTTCIDKIIKSENIKNILKPAFWLFLPLLWAVNHYLYASTGSSVKIIFNILFPSPFNVEFSFFFVMLGLAWYFFNNKFINCVILQILSVICLFAQDRLTFYPTGHTFWHLFTPNQWLMILAVPFILLYNGEKGRGGLKYLFYIYYPLHHVAFMIFSVYF